MFLYHPLIQEIQISCTIFRKMGKGRRKTQKASISAVEHQLGLLHSALSLINSDKGPRPKRPGDLPRGSQLFDGAVSGAVNY